MKKLLSFLALLSAIHLQAQVDTMSNGAIDTSGNKGGNFIMTKDLPTIVIPVVTKGAVSTRKPGSDSIGITTETGFIYRYKISDAKTIGDSVYLSGVKLTDYLPATYYSRSEVNGLLFDKANNSTVAGLSNAVNARVKYSDSGAIYVTPSMLSASNTTIQNSFNGYYTKSQSDGRYLQSFTETDPVYSAQIGNYYNKTQSDARYLQTIPQQYADTSRSYSKNQSDARYKPVGYSPSSSEITSALGFTPYNATNPNGYISSVPAQSFASLTGKPTTLGGYGITDAYPLTGNPSGFLTVVPAQSWSSITGKPTTISGYGITDAASTARSSIGLTTTGTGAATYNSSTGVLNVPTPTNSSTVWSKSNQLSTAGVIVTDTFSVASATPTVTLNLPTGTTTAKLLSVTGYRAGATAQNSPQVSITAFTNTSVSLALTQSNSTAVSLLGINVLGLQAVPDPANVKVLISYIAY